MPIVSGMIKFRRRPPATGLPDTVVVCCVVDHYSVAFTLDVYGHVTNDMKRDAADKVSGVLKGAV